MAKCGGAGKCVDLTRRVRQEEMEKSIVGSVNEAVFHPGYQILAILLPVCLRLVVYMTMTEIVYGFLSYDN